MERDIDEKTQRGITKSQFDCEDAEESNEEGAGAQASNEEGAGAQASNKEGARD